MSELNKFIGVLSPPINFEDMDKENLVKKCAELQVKWLAEQNIGMSLSLEFEELANENLSLKQQLDEARSHPTIEACRQMIEAQAVKENEELRQQLAAAQDDAIEQARIVGMGGEREIALRQQVTLLRKQVLEECAAIAEDTAAGRDAEAIADAIRAMKYKSG